MNRKSVRAIVSGRVQGVWFRQSTKQTAISLGITGSAVNLPDGRVEVHAHGENEAVNRLLEWLHEGPELARVIDVEVVEISSISIPEDFTTG
ncbi:acylphosphatase [Hahella sp. CCB-MM4]|uniref:acylphosphatase n=1 Tax=Hahella sp. (strain CCB-MM4) TaxID=1926491 RepID=UPI000B9A196D|nr:acylphosphatase [Hahella sp. CCB-MM4]OZG73892.1 acylphosphatase [Hahella sp. CCB-MM4]